MSNALFPTLIGLAWNSVWTPVFKTKIQTAVSGKEYRSAMMSSPLYKVSLSYEFLRHGQQADLRSLVGFFLARQGSFDSFLYSHPEDNAVTDQLLGTANGTATFQLCRSFGSEFLEAVQNVTSVVNVKVGGTVVAASGYNVSATGLITFTSPPSSGSVTWSGKYLYRARFAADDMAYEKFMQDLWTAKKVEFMASLGTKI